MPEQHTTRGDHWSLDGNRQGKVQQSTQEEVQRDKEENYSIGRNGKRVTYVHEKAVFDVRIDHMCVDYTKGMPHPE